MRSPLWKMFVKQANFKATCKRCNAILSYKSGSTNLWKHIAAVHKQYKSMDLITEEPEPTNDLKRETDGEHIFEEPSDKCTPVWEGFLRSVERIPATLLHYAKCKRCHRIMKGRIKTLQLHVKKCFLRDPLSNTSLLDPLSNNDDSVDMAPASSVIDSPKTTKPERKCKEKITPKSKVIEPNIQPSLDTMGDQVEILPSDFLQDLEDDDIEVFQDIKYRLQEFATRSKSRDSLKTYLCQLAEECDRLIAECDVEDS